jgi:hypothetical protein
MRFFIAGLGNRLSSHAEFHPILPRLRGIKITATSTELTAAGARSDNQPQACRSRDDAEAGPTKIDESRRIRAAVMIREGLNDFAAKSKKRTALDKGG